ncbi:MAG: 2,3-diaminopropionate biosynthesis protein SbnB [Bacteroidota bacterium]
MIVLTGPQVDTLLHGHEHDIMAAIAEAYVAHHEGQSNLPNSSFLRFPGKKRERIIALPAYLGGGFQTAGIKWIASFPENVHQGLERASAALLLNDVETGHATALLEGSIISARRTAASAALAAQQLHGEDAPHSVSIIGCGLISFEIVRFLTELWPELDTLVVRDLSPDRAAQFAERVDALQPGITVRVAQSAEEALAASPVVSFATTAVEPWLDSLDALAPGSTVLHISLRDLTPELILANNNIVDDREHVCRAQTSVHLAEQSVGHRDFIGRTLAELLSGAAPEPTGAGRHHIFSPFGLGVLDLALATIVESRAHETGVGMRIPEFLPAPWTERAETHQVAM